jgi:uncharacterized membrane protein (DUF2068 family)
MTENAQIPQVAGKPRKAPTLYFIVAIKLIKGVSLLAGAVSVYVLANKNLPELFDQLIRWMHLDPEGRFFNAVGDQLDTITPRNVHVIASWMFLYGLFLCFGGLGLAFRAPWAVWLAIGESAFFIPIEIFELVRKHIPNPDAPPHPMFPHPKLGLAIVLAINVLIVAYLFKNRERLFRHHH